MARAVGENFHPMVAMERLPVQRYDPTQDGWVDLPTADSDTRIARLRCVTFNAWFQGPEPAIRYSGLLEAVERADADVIMLQEVTVPLADAAMAREWVRRGYAAARSPFRKDGIPSHGLLVLTRLPPSEVLLYPLPTHMGRSLLAMKCRLNGNPFTFATAHFESMRPYADVRGRQLEKTFQVLESAGNALLCGDFNFCSSWPEENSRIDPRYADLWAVLRPRDPGYTLDTDTNRMLAKSKRERKQVRYDRILLRSDAGQAQWRPAAICLLGTEPVDRRWPGIYPSDHFGLAAELVRVD